MALWNSLAFLMIQQMLATWSLVPLPFLNPAWTSEVHGSHTIEAWLGEFWALLYLCVRWVQLCHSVVVWAFFGIAFLWDWNEKGFPCGSAGKESACNVGDLGSIPGLGRLSGEGEGYPLQYSGLENSMDWVHGVAKSQTWLSDFHNPIISLKSLFP